jgi:glutamate-1-semialdehyde aminotransferase
MNYLLNEGYDNNIKVSKGYKSKIIINNKNYLDLSFCAGTLILGHNSKIYKDSLNKIIKNKISNFAVPNIYAEKMSELLNNTFPHYKKFIFCNSGSESVLKAIRIAKAISKKDLIVSVSGSWHGSIDQFLFSADKNLSPIANCDGLSNFYKKNLKIIPYNDIEKSKKILNRIKNKISAIIIEPIQACLPMEDAVKYLKFLEKFSKKK